MPIGSIISGGVSLLGGLFGGNKASSAAQQSSSELAKAYQAAIDLQKQIYQTTQNNLAPWLASGQNALSDLTNYVGSGQGWAAPQQTWGYGPDYNFTAPTLQTFQQSPGYQYQLGQTLNSARNAAIPSGGALSGNMLKALQTNASGLANQDWYNYLNSQFNQYNTSFNAQNQTYQQRVNEQIQNQQQTFNMLNALSGAGQNAAANLGGIGTQVGTQIGNNLIGQGAATAAGTVGSANAQIGGLNSLVGLFGGGGGIGGGGSSGGGGLGNIGNFFANLFTNSGGGNQPIGTNFGDSSFGSWSGGSDPVASLA